MFRESINRTNGKFPRLNVSHACYRFLPLVKLMKHEVVEREFFSQNEILLMIPFSLSSANFFC